MSKKSNSIVAIGITIFLLYYMNSYIILGIFIILLLLFLYKYKYKYKNIVDDIVKVETPNNNDKHYNDNITNSLNKIKKYKKYNLNDYHEGMKYFHKFMDTIHTLENRNLKHHRQYIENAKLYLNRSINHFQNITYSVPDKKLLSGLKYNDYTSTKKSKKLHKYIDELYKTSYHILFTIVNKNNKKVIENPDIYKGIIDLNIPESSNYFNKNELY
jgi:hypothetical protein